jgi:hypothetical protein
MELAMAWVLVKADESALVMAAVSALVMAMGSAKE